MGRHYERKVGARHYRDYTQEQLKQAIQAVCDGVSLRDAAEEFNIPKSTLENKFKGKHANTVGHPTVLSKEVELMIVKYLCSSAEFGFPQN